MASAYDGVGAVAGRDDVPVLAAVIAVVVGAVLGRQSSHETELRAALALAAAAAAVLAAARSRRVAMGPAAGAIVVALLGVSAVRAGAEWRAVDAAQLGEWKGWAVVVADPAPRGAATSTVLRLDGRRYEAWAYGALRHKVAQLEAGDRVRIAGTRSLIGDAAARRRAAARHIVGRVRLDLLADVRDGTPLAIAATRVGSALRTAADDSMPAPLAALFTGLVIGDDARQDPAMVEQFRAAGLSHLTAVSGQNVAFVLLVAAPLLRRLRPLARWCATAALVGSFAVVARGEPSVLRAGVMAALSATAFAAGRPVRPLRLLGVAVTGLVLVDPFLAWSVGFWLSVGATAGVCAVAPAVERRLPGPPWCAAPLSLTIGAQAGVALPALVVFGRMPITSLVANPAAGAVAGAVMAIGLPSAACSAVLSAMGAAPVGRAAMWPSEAGTRWVAEVARVTSALDPPVWVSLAAWAGLGAWLALRPARTAVPI